MERSTPLGLYNNRVVETKDIIQKAISYRELCAGPHGPSRTTDALRSLTTSHEITLARGTRTNIELTRHPLVDHVIRGQSAHLVRYVARYTSELRKMTTLQKSTCPTA